MVKKGEKKIVYRERIGISFTVIELIAALAVSEADWAIQHEGEELQSVFITFEFIAQKENDKMVTGIDCKKGSLQEFLSANSFLADKIEKCSICWLHDKYIEQIATSLKQKDDDGFGDN